GACSLALDFDKTSEKAGQGVSTGAFCAQHEQVTVAFCDDFDGPPLGTKWPSVEQANGTVTNDAQAAVSGTSSLLSIANAVPVGAGVRAVGTKSFANLNAQPVGLRISFKVRVDQFDATSGAKNTIFDFLYGPMGDYNQIVVNLVSTETAVSIQVAENAQKAGSATSDYALHGPFDTKPTIGQWMKVDLNLDITQPIGTGNRLRVLLDDKQELDTTLQLPLKGDTPRVELGVGWVDSSKPTQSWAVRYDDFLVDTVRL
ncbi:MAG TPA: hypothetical protein VHM25_24220, partial [Polyangiaceae bacterium]|nr:hypothetical protein [Polyangiaceae bacterium]